MGKFKLKNNKKTTKLEIFDNKINSFIDAIIPAIIIMIPVVFILYILNVHGIIFPKTAILFRLDKFYRYLTFILGFIYIYKIIIKKVSVTKSDIFLFIFMFFTFLSFIFAHNQYIALYGYPNRYEGVYTLLFYCFLYLNCKLLSKNTDIKYLVRMLISTAIVHFIFVILQLTGLYGELIYMYTSNDAIGLTGNCNFLGSLMCLISAICFSGYIIYTKKDSNVYFLIIGIISYITLLLANSTGPFISFVMTLVILIITMFIKRNINYKKLIVSLIIIVLLYPVCLYKKDEITPEIKHNFKTIWHLVFKEENESLEKNEMNDTNKVDKDTLMIKGLGNGRIRIWSNTWKLIKEKPLIGYGPDNLGLVYEKSAGDNKIADKAHNIYLHIFVSSGVFAVISYILWLIYTIYLGIKSKDNTVFILSIGVIAYCIQGLFNINVIEVTPYFYIVIGLMMFLINEKSINIKKIFKI